MLQHNPTFASQSQALPRVHTVSPFQLSATTVPGYYTPVLLLQQRLSSYSVPFSSQKFSYLFSHQIWPIISKPLLFVPWSLPPRKRVQFYLFHIKWKTLALKIHRDTHSNWCQFRLPAIQDFQPLLAVSLQPSPIFPNSYFKPFLHPLSHHPPIILCPGSAEGLVSYFTETPPWVLPPRLLRLHPNGSSWPAAFTHPHRQGGRTPPRLVPPPRLIPCPLCLRNSYYNNSNFSKWKSPTYHTNEHSWHPVFRHHKVKAQFHMLSLPSSKLLTFSIHTKTSPLNSS